MRLGKKFGVDFQGCENEALQLFMKIDQKRQINKEKAGQIETATPITKISKELKSLDFGSNFKSNGTSSKGGYHINQDQ